MTKKPDVTAEFHAMGTIDAPGHPLDGQRIDIEASLNLGEDFGNAVKAILESEDSSFGALCALSGLNPKIDLAFGDFNEGVFKDEGDLLEGANLRRCNLARTVWENTSIKSALLEAADFTDAQGLTEEDFARAYISPETILPKNIDRARVLELHKALGMPAIEPYKPNGKKGMISFPATATITDTTPARPRFPS